jgi:hypothetical protein
MHDVGLERVEEARQFGFGLPGHADSPGRMQRPTM